jgi:hypothetical protein
VRTPLGARRGRAVTVAALAAAGLVGLGIGVGPHVFGSSASGAREFDTQHSAQHITLPSKGNDLSAAAVAKRFENTYKPIAPAAPDPRTAVRRFIDGEIERNDRLSYGQLSVADRVAYPSVSDWTLHEAQSAQLTGATILALSQHGNAAAVRVALQQKPSLDEIQGLVTSRANAVFQVVREDGGWRVLLASSTIASEYPSASAASVAALTWVRDRQHCASGTAVQWRSDLYGDGADFTASKLCNASGTPSLGSPRALDDSDQSAPLLAAFGPDVELWARVVPLRAPVQADLVLAPVGERWLVVGLLSSSPTGGQG